MLANKREFAARMFAAAGLTSVLESLPRHNAPLVLNYHRIGEALKTDYDSGVFSTTADEFDQQISYLKRHFHMITLAEAIAMVSGEAPLESSVLVTFDDGYLDNYTLAFPILRSHGVQGVFFLPTALIGTDHVPFWDVIAYVVKHSRNSLIHMKYPRATTFDLEAGGLDHAVVRILRLSKEAATEDLDLFIAELREACGVPDLPPNSTRSFLNWQEAQEMNRAGMAVGSHTHHHKILSRLSPEQQFDEVCRSRRILEERLEAPIETLSYPEGARDAFNSDTFGALRENGYRAAFSFYGGMNRSENLNPFDIKRYGVDRPSQARFRLQTNLAACTGSGWF